MTTPKTKFNTDYLLLLHALLDSPELMTRGMKCREILFQGLQIKPQDNKITDVPGFETNLKYAAEELKWYYSGSSRIDFSPLIQRTWAKFSDDGVTANSAYGQYLFGLKFITGIDKPISQWDWVKQELMMNPQSRRAVININQYYHKKLDTKDMPCTMFLQFFIRQGRLYMLTAMRSQDIYLGMRNDVYCFTEMQKRMAKELGVKLGAYHHFCSSLHLYETEYERARQALEKFKYY